ncbi:hypothetical protein KYJ26_12155 [Bacillus sp. MCCB 382]|uniref:hypothetical protein n=1 Tax=Bacillus sp. MCCB 382 TaxID=2860197 RepID=UPI001C58F60D|nr:hypothetical protein [Bacillus sp. MCCB 382]
MKKILFSIVGVLLMCVCLFWFTDILSSTLSFGPILMGVLVSVVWNGFFVRVLIREGTLYKSRLYPVAVYQIFFLLLAGIMFIVSSDKTYRVDAWDGVIPYVMLALVALIHGFVLLVVVKWSKELV